MEFSSKNLFPWITYNNVDVADSQFCIEYLSKLLGKNMNAKFDDKQAGMARCLLKISEESLRWSAVLHRFIYSAEMNAVYQNGHLNTCNQE
jgi:hypothetical protein